MKKVLVLIICVMLLLSACSETINRVVHSTESEDEMIPYLYDPTDKMFEDTINTLFYEISSNDRSAVKELFAHNAVVQDSTFEEDLDVLMGFVEGRIISVEGTGAHGSSSFEQNYVKTITEEYYFVHTDQESYIFIIVACLVDTTDPDNIGIQTLRVLREEDEEIYFASWDDVKLPGIYVGLGDQEDGTVVPSGEPK